MKHSIVLWDCCFRNFYHTLGSLAQQNYPKEHFEVIVVEQRSREESDAYNHTWGCPTLYEIVERFRLQMNVQLIFMNEPKVQMYHWGRALNRGIAKTTGEIISTMDADMVFQDNFLSDLDEFHSRNSGVANMLRLMADRPAGVTLDNWKEGKLDFDSVLSECPDAGADIPTTLTNKAPLISARRSLWEQTEGFEEHAIWATGLSRNGQDLVCRMELITKRPSLALQTQFAVHPWHPAGFSRKTPQSTIILESHRALSLWSIQHNEPKRSPRKRENDRVFERYNTYYQNHWKQRSPSGLAAASSWILALKMKCMNRFKETFHGRPAINGLNPIASHRRPFRSAPLS
jgi:glycosyltransferase involved in cell wall biosynthesis